MFTIVLTPTESRIVELLKAGRTFKEISNELEITTQATSNHMVRIYGKLGISTEDSDRVSLLLEHLNKYGYYIESNSGGRRLSEEQIFKIKQLAKEVSTGALSERYNVSRSTIRRAVNEPITLGEQIKCLLKKLSDDFLKNN